MRSEGRGRPTATAVRPASVLASEAACEPVGLACDRDGRGLGDRAGQIASSGLHPKRPTPSGPAKRRRNRAQPTRLTDLFEGR